MILSNSKDFCLAQAVPPYPPRSDSADVATIPFLAPHRTTPFVFIARCGRRSGSVRPIHGQGSQNTAGSVISAGSTWPRFTAISLTPSVVSCSYLAHAYRAVLNHICPNVSCRGCEQGVVVGKLAPSFSRKLQLKQRFEADI